MKPDEMQKLRAIINRVKGTSLMTRLIEKLEDALDTFEIEPPVGNKLLTLPNLICTPHIGGQCDEGQLRASIQVAKKVIKELSGE